MPLIKVQASVTTERMTIETMLKQLSASLASHLGKPESYVMTAFEGEVPMTFAGSSEEPVCYIEIKSIGTMGAKAKAMSQDFCAQIEKTLGVPQNRTYIAFTDATGAMWGWNGTTFG